MKKTIDEFNEVRICSYKDEIYSVRDNGAVMRHAKNEAHPRKLDCTWTFGTKNEKTGYMTIGMHRVHIIVATAFHGANDSTKLVVDHIDTNRCNNRPGNLRWITRLENVLLNAATRKKVAYLCGGIENFIKDPSCLHDFSGTNQDVAWMRTVSAEEARTAYENVMQWVSYDNQRDKSGCNLTPKDPEWMFKTHDVLNVSSSAMKSNPIPRQETPHYVQALSPSIAVQLRWSTPSHFPCCPSEVDEPNVLEEYSKRLGKGVVFAKNDIWESRVLDSALYDNGRAIAVMTAPEGYGAMKLAVCKVYVANGKIVHETEGTYFSTEGARKYFTLLQGLEWAGGDCIDDYC